MYALSRDPAFASFCGTGPGFIAQISALRVQTKIESHGSSRTRTPLLARTLPPRPPPRQTGPAGLQSSRTMPHPTWLTANPAPPSLCTHHYDRKNSPRLRNSATLCQTVRDTSNPIRRLSSRAIHEIPSPRFSPRSNSPLPPYQRESQGKSVTCKVLIRAHIAGLPRFHTPFQSQNVSRPTPHHTRNRRHSVFPRHSGMPSKPNSHRQLEVRLGGLGAAGPRSAHPVDGGAEAAGHGNAQGHDREDEASDPADDRNHLKNRHQYRAKKRREHRVDAR